MKVTDYIKFPVNCLNFCLTNHTKKTVGVVMATSAVVFCINLLARPGTDNTQDQIENEAVGNLASFALCALAFASNALFNSKIPTVTCAYLALAALTLPFIYHQASNKMDDIRNR